MDTYSLLREFADSWVLLAMFCFFVLMIVWVFRPGSTGTYNNAAAIPLRDETAGEPVMRSDHAGYEEYGQNKGERDV